MTNQPNYEMNSSEGERLLIATFKEKYDKLAREINKLAFEKNMNPEAIAAFFITAAVIGIMPYRDPNADPTKFINTFTHDFFMRMVELTAVAANREENHEHDHH